jgi:hypothetical protein
MGSKCAAMSAAVELHAGKNIASEKTGGGLTFNLFVLVFIYGFCLFYRHSTWQITSFFFSLRLRDVCDNGLIST